MKGVRRYAIAVATVACFAVGVAGVLRVVGWSNLAGGDIDGVRQPIAFDDYALQFYYGQLGSRFLSEAGVTYGYDPNFMAGYPKTPVYYPSSKPYEYALMLFSGIDPGTVFNFTVFSMLAVLPFLMYGAAANYRFSAGERLAVVAMSVVPHFMVPVAGFYGIMEAAGMVPYIFASFLSVYVVSLLHRFLGRGERAVGLALLVAAPLLFLSHLTAAFISAVPIAAIYLTKLRATPLRRHLWLWLVLLALIVANWSWIEGYLLFSHYADLGEYYTPEGSEHFVPKGGLLAPFLVYVASPKLVSLVPPLFGAIGLWAWWRKRRTEMLVIFAPQILVLFVVSFYGVHLGLNAVAPARLTLPLGLYLFFPAAHALAAAARKAVAWIQPMAPPEWSNTVTVGVATALALAAILSGLPAKIWRPYTLPMLEKREGFSDHGMALIAWLRDNTDANGRILHEETNRDAHQYYGSHMPSWIPIYAGRELAGGPAPHALLKHNVLRFIAGTFLGKPIQRIEPRTLSSYFSLYNVRWVLCWKRSTKRFFGRLPLATHVGNFDKFALYRIEIPPSFFLRGSGRVDVQGSRIVLSEIAPEDGVVAIKYHWLETLRTEPPRTIEPVYQLDDPIPFISVKDPTRELVIFNDFDRGLFDVGG